MCTTLTSPRVVVRDKREIRRCSLCLAPLIHLLRGPRDVVRRPWGVEHDELENHKGMKRNFAELERVLLGVFRAGFMYRGIIDSRV